MSRKLGHAPSRRFTEASPRCEEPLSTTQKILSAEAGVGLHAHHLLYQPTERLDAVLRLATTEKLRPLHVPGSQVGQSPLAFVLVLHPHEPLLGARQGGLAAMASLDRGLLVGRDHVLLGTERLTLPFTLVEVQHPPGFMGEVGISGRNPGAVVEGPQGIFGKPSPDGGSRDLGHEPPLHRLPGHFLGAPAAQGNPATSRKLASQCLKLYPCRRGERSGACPSVADPPVLLTPLGKSACATYRPSGAWCKASVRSPCWGSLLRPKARSWREPPPSGEQCGRRLASPERRAHPRWVVHGTDFGWACNKPSPLGNTTSTKTLPRKENASKKFSQGPLSRVHPAYAHPEHRFCRAPLRAGVAGLLARSRQVPHIGHCRAILVPKRVSWDYSRSHSP